MTNAAIAGVFDGARVLSLAEQLSGPFATASVISGNDRAAWDATLDSTGVSWSPVHDVHDVGTDPRFRARRLFARAPGDNDTWFVRQPVRFSRYATGLRRGAEAVKVGESAMSKEPQDAVELAVSGAVATLTLNRPGSYNALNPGLARGLRTHAETVEAREELRVMVVRGAGRGFCGGGDIGEMAARKDTPGGDDTPRFLSAMLEDVHAFLETLARMPQVVVAAVHGVAAGAGLSLASMADLCVATEDAAFVPSYLALGVSPDCGGTVGTVRAAGVRGALDLYLLRDRLTAREAQQFGLVNVVVPPERLDEELNRIAERVCRMPALAVANTKRLVRQAPATPLRQQLDAEGAGLIACTDTDSFRRGMAAFLKR